MRGSRRLRDAGDIAFELNDMRSETSSSIRR